MAHRGWIEPVDVGCPGLTTIEKEGNLLEALGVKLGPWIVSDNCWDDCEVPHEALPQLKEFEGQFIFGLSDEME